jgi:hypothetical protein
MQKSHLSVWQDDRDAIHATGNNDLLREGMFLFQWQKFPAVNWNWLIKGLRLFLRLDGPCETGWAPYQDWNKSIRYFWALKC